MLLTVTFLFSADSSVCSREIPLENFRANYEEEVVMHSASDPVGVPVHGLHLLTFLTYIISVTYPLVFMRASMQEYI